MAKEFDINCLYQSYIATDFSIMDGEVKFEGGKNNRDILGSYYTQEEFAYEITQKAIEEYLENNIREEVNELKIADYSCGGGAFLVAACRICSQKGISADIYGYDVDPIAIMITRHRLRLADPPVTAFVSNQNCSLVKAGTFSAAGVSM